MSLEAWGDEGLTGPDGYVTDEIHQEAVDENKEALRLILQTHSQLGIVKDTVSHLEDERAMKEIDLLRKRLEEWLEFHTPKQPGESLDVAIAREGKDPTFPDNDWLCEYCGDPDNDTPSTHNENICENCFLVWQ